MTSVFHDAYPEDRIAMAAFRRELASHPPIAFGPSARPMFDLLMASTPGARDVVYTADTVGGVPGWWARPVGAVGGAAMLYLHGGAHVVGSAKAYQNFVGQLASRGGLATFTPDYRLAPEHPFPADLDDARAAYEGLANGGFGKIMLAGDSAGGGLALSLLAELSQVARRGIGRRPLAAVVMSPWTDLSLAGPSLTTRAEADPLLSREILELAVKQYLGTHSRIDPRVSPIFGHLDSIAPAMIHVGEDEVLLDDARFYARQMESAGNDVVVHVWEGMTHVFPSNLAFLQAAREALDQMGGYIRQALSVRFAHSGLPNRSDRPAAL